MPGAVGTSAGGSIALGITVTAVRGLAARTIAASTSLRVTMYRYNRSPTFSTASNGSP
ncbi:hypothetical protein GCM10009836_40810 [Pseudonocardia ailaonensis]|uniref:Uncharacterized protein n=1 Tax=Pseudonocardia ailaonensis TaxID=367279 RepID=A0ABN2N7L5_9PSEU